MGRANTGRRAWGPLPLVGQLPAGNPVFLVPVSLLEFLPGPRICLLLLVRGGDVCVWLFFVFVLLSAHRNITLASSLAAQLFCGSLEKRLEYIPSESERVL